MGSFFSIPLARPPYIFALTESQLKEAEEDKEEGDEDNIFAECHAANLADCARMERQNDRSKLEEERFNENRRRWNEVVEKLKEKYPQWTSEDISNLRFHFEHFAEEYGYLLHFSSALIEMLDFFQHDSSPEQRRAMFDSVDVHHYGAINFEEYLQLMNNMEFASPVPTSTWFEEDRDEIMRLCYEISQADTFTQMCFGLF